MKNFCALRGIMPFLLVGMMTACSPVAGENVHHEKNTSIERVDILGQVEEGFWVNEKSSGRGVAPGPSERWQEGLARLSAAEFDGMRKAYQWKSVEYWTPPIRSSLNGKLKFGSTWLESEEFNAAGSTAEFKGAFYLEAESRVVLFFLSEVDT